MPLPFRRMIYNHVHEQTYCFILGFLHVIYMKYLPKISETLPLCPAYSIMKI